MRILIVLFGAFFSLISMAQASTYTAKLYEQGSNQKNELFQMTTSFSKSGDITHVETVFKDLGGDPVFIEKAQLKGSALIKTSIEQKQKGSQAEIEVKNNKVFFSLTENGKTKTAQEKLGKTLVVSPNFQLFVWDNWDHLVNGKTIEFRYGVWSRKETVGFEIFKVSEEEYQGEKLMVLKMKPSSFIISALVKPLFFKFSLESKKLIMMNGRVAPMQKKGKSFEDLDAEVFYSY